MLPLTLVNFFSPLLNLLLFNHTKEVIISPSTASHPSLRFELRHYHAVTPNAQVLFHDAVPPEHALSPTLGAPQSQSPYNNVRTRRLTTHRPSLSLDDPDFVKVWRKSRSRGDYYPPDRLRAQEQVATIMSWDEEEVEAPDVESRETLLQLAKLANNAYLLPNETGWYDLGGSWNVVSFTFLSLFLFSMYNALTKNIFVALSRTPSDGSQMRMAFEGMSLLPPITRRLFSQSRVHPQAMSEAAVLRPRKTNSTTIYCSVAAVLAWVGLGRLYVDVIVEGGSVISRV